jgi:hypothetical protein
MVFEYEDYPFTSKSGIKTEVSTRTDYERNFLESIKSGIFYAIQGIRYSFATFSHKLT